MMSWNMRFASVVFFDAWSCSARLYIAGGTRGDDGCLTIREGEGGSGGEGSIDPGKLCPDGRGRQA